MTGKASEPTAAPTWLDRPLPSMVGTPGQPRPARDRPPRDVPGRGAGLPRRPLRRALRYSCQRSCGPSGCIRKMVGRSIYTLWLWISSCASCAAWSPSSRRAPSPTRRSRSASPRLPCPGPWPPSNSALGVRLLRRTSRDVTPTAAGQQVVAHARRVLGEVDDLMRAASSGHTQVRVGYAWSALGRHTATFQRRWSQAHPGTDLHLVRINSATAGLAEGSCDLARGAPAAGRPAVRVGHRRPGTPAVRAGRRRSAGPAPCGAAG